MTAKQACLENFALPTRQWFQSTFSAPTDIQLRAWPQIQAQKNTLLLAPTGSGKTLAAFLVSIDRIMFGGRPKPSATDHGRGIRVLYVSPLKALGVDVERNLRSPLTGVTTVAERLGADHCVPRIAVRSGDTSADERRRIQKHPPDILITTPESIYLMLTSRAREVLATVETVIIDEIHSLVGNKRGAHLFLSLERLERLRQESDAGVRPLQRIGLSATQRPLDEIARLLGGLEQSATGDFEPRPVQIVQSKRRKTIELTIEVPVEDMSRLSQDATGAAAGPGIPSIWPAIHPRLVELIREHRSTMIFVNSRRLAERLAQAINELAEEELALAHHGSIARETRTQIEDRLKTGSLPAIVATSSLELGIDMGAVDLVIQIESPPSIASGIQRIGRANHQVDGRSRGIVFPKYRGDLLACSAAASRMQQGEVESTFYPRNPLDVLAQQIVAMVAMEPISVETLYATVRRAAPFADLPRSAFDGILDLLSGRYPSHEFSELRPRINWDRIAGIVSPRRGAQRLAVLNAGTIPDRGLYGVFLADGDNGGSRRVGELDEEMVFETRPGDVFLLGASAWRVVDITHDRVLVVPASGEPGKMPFWRGDSLGRPLEFGKAIGRLARELVALPRAQAIRQLTSLHALDQRAAENLIAYLHDQKTVTAELPSDQTVVVESFQDEIGDWRVCVLSPFGARVHAPWAMAVAQRLSEESARDVDMMWTDDGIVFRLPDADAPPDPQTLFPSPDDVEQIIVQRLATSALFASRFRENAARALLLPRRMPGKRTPLWLQRRRSADLLSVASRYPSFPILLESYRECLRDVFDVPGLRSVLRQVESRKIRVHSVRSETASPFAASLLFNYVGNFLYEGDAPLAERRAASLALDHSQLRELLGDAELRELLDPEAVADLSLELQFLGPQFIARDQDAVRDLLMKLGDLSLDEIRCRLSQTEPDQLLRWMDDLQAARDVIEIRIGGQARFIAVEDAARYRDALGVALPTGLPDSVLSSDPAQQPLDDLLLRYARTHVPFRVSDAARHFSVSDDRIVLSLRRLAGRDLVLEGEFLPGQRGREWCHPDVLKLLKRRSLARLRKQVEPVSQQTLARFLPVWHGIDRPRTGLDGLLDAIEQIQGVPIPADDLEQFVLPARVRDFRPSDLDQLCAAGEVTWQGCGSGEQRADIALYLTDHRQMLAMNPDTDNLSELAQAVVDVLTQRGAMFFEDLTAHLNVFADDVLKTLWELVWCGIVTNDSLAPLRSLRLKSQKGRRGRQRPIGRFRSRRVHRRPGAEGRWSLFMTGSPASTSDTQRQFALAAHLLQCNGVLTREQVTNRGIRGGFTGIYPVLKAMEESGRVRRGYFVDGLGATQFAVPGADDRLRELRETSEATPVVLAATDPANTYGTVLRWPANSTASGLRPGRVAGARVILLDGRLVGFLSRSGQHLLTFFSEEQHERKKQQQAVGQALTELARERAPVYLTQIDNHPAATSHYSDFLQSLGFVATSQGLQLRSARNNDAGR